MWSLDSKKIDTLPKLENLKFIKCGNSTKKENSSSLIIHEN